MKFFDRAGKELYAYNPKNRSGEVRKQNLEANEELIGVYGNYGGNEIRSLGFILKLKEAV